MWSTRTTLTINYNVMIVNLDNTGILTSTAQQFHVSDAARRMHDKRYMMICLQYAMLRDVTMRRDALHCSSMHWDASIQHGLV